MRYEVDSQSEWVGITRAFCSFLLLWWALSPGSLFSSFGLDGADTNLFRNYFLFGMFHFPLFILAGAAWLFAKNRNAFLFRIWRRRLWFRLLVFYRIVEQPLHKIVRSFARVIEEGGRPL
jgi:hypothetical protein